jgi:hypothetical protein
LSSHSEIEAHMTARKSHLIATLVAVLMLAVPWTAFAGNVESAVLDTVAPYGSTTLAPGQAQPIVIVLRIGGPQDGVATFKVYRNYTLQGGAFVGSDPVTFTVQPHLIPEARYYTLDGTLSVAAGHSAGTYYLSVIPFDITNSVVHGNKLKFGGAVSYKVIVPAAADTTPPVLSLPANMVVEATGPNGAAVTFTATATDDNPANPAVTCVPPSGSTFPLGVTTVNCSATDAAGNTATGSFKITVQDTTPPAITWVGGPAAGGTYVEGAVPAAPTCTALDIVWGSVPCNVSGYSAAVGTHTMTAAATDGSGNTATATRSYTVTPAAQQCAVQGFFPPVTATTGPTIAWNTVKGGSTVPLKFKIFSGSTELTSTSYVVQPLTGVRIDCKTLAELGTENLTPAGSTALRYDAAGGQFIFNWQTPRTPGVCYKVTVAATCGGSATAYFQLK